ncbi:MAG: bacillithiol system redox-active protein YtxJ [Flavobacterium sp.]
MEETPLDEIVKTSFEKPVTLFKHSTRCSISRFALKQFEKEYNIETVKMELYFLDLLEHRSISNEVTERFGVMHQSPQIIVIKDGKAIYHASHSDIQAEDLNQFVL